jgi:hypothetical protein
VTIFLCLIEDGLLLEVYGFTERDPACELIRNTAARGRGETEK